jgi:cyclic 2,3-diphosphoglycerate synthetase
VRACAIVDGEHYPAVVRDALRDLPYEFVAAWLVGGTDKLRGTPDYGVPLVDDVPDCEIAVDLTDERRPELVAAFLAAAIPYVGADFRFDPPPLHPFELPSISVIGTGKRVGKTAVATHVARLLARDRSVVCVAMGRGGPAEPELVTEPPTVEELVARSRAGQHAASDFLELAVLTGLPAVGCRRAGGGVAGAPFVSNVLEGARLAASLEPDVVVFDGSGSAIPPVDTTARILVGREPFRERISDLVLDELELRLEPTAPLEGRVAVFTAAPARTEHLDPVFVSHDLARRELLREQLAGLDADTYLVELKAAAIDVVAEHALAHGARVVLARNEVVSPALDEQVLALLEPVLACARRPDGARPGAEVQALPAAEWE